MATERKVVNIITDLAAVASRVDDVSSSVAELLKTELLNFENLLIELRDDVVDLDEADERRDLDQLREDVNMLGWAAAVSEDAQVTTALLDLRDRLAEELD